MIHTPILPASGPHSASPRSKVIEHPRAAPVPPAAVSRVLARFDRHQLAAFIVVAIDLLDVADGDTDLELSGDELDGGNAEDDFAPHSHHGVAAGCPIADPGEDGDDDRCAAGDDGCGDFPLHGQLHRGAEADFDYLPTNVYGIDQSKGPIGATQGHPWAQRDGLFPGYGETIHAA